MNPFSALAELALGWIKDKILVHWLNLIFELVWSGILTFLFVCGSALAAKVLTGVAIGAGMVSSAVTMTIVFRRSPLTKGLLLVLPSAEALKEIQTDVETIQR